MTVTVTVIVNVVEVEGAEIEDWRRPRIIIEKMKREPRMTDDSQGSVSVQVLSEMYE